MAIRIWSSTENLTVICRDSVSHPIPTQICFMVWNVTKMGILEHKPEVWIGTALASCILTFKYMEVCTSSIFSECQRPKSVLV